MQNLFIKKLLQGETGITLKNNNMKQGPNKGYAWNI